MLYKPEVIQLAAYQTDPRDTVVCGGTANHKRIVRNPCNELLMRETQNTYFESLYR